MAPSNLSRTIRFIGSLAMFSLPAMAMGAAPQPPASPAIPAEAKPWLTEWAEQQGLRETLNKAQAGSPDAMMSLYDALVAAEAYAKGPYAEEMDTFTSSLPVLAAQHPDASAYAHAKASLMHYADRHFEKAYQQAMSASEKDREVADEVLTDWVVQVMGEYSGQLPAPYTLEMSCSREAELPLSSCLDLSGRGDGAAKGEIFSHGMGMTYGAQGFPSATMQVTRDFRLYLPQTGEAGTTLTVTALHRDGSVYQSSQASPGEMLIMKGEGFDFE